MPFILYTISRLVTVYVSPGSSSYNSELLAYSLWFVYLGVPITLVEPVRLYSIHRLAETQVAHLQSKYYEALLRQETAWHEGQDSAKLVGRLVNELFVSRFA